MGVVPYYTESGGSLGYTRGNVAGVGDSTVVYAKSSTLIPTLLMLKPDLAPPIILSFQIRMATDSAFGRASRLFLFSSVLALSRQHSINPFRPPAGPRIRSLHDRPFPIVYIHILETRQWAPLWNSIRFSYSTFSINSESQFQKGYVCQFQKEMNHKYLVP